jgi:hypothetical protein
MRITLLVAASMVAACSSSSTTSSSSSSGDGTSSSGGSSSGSATSSGDPGACDPAPEGTQSTTVLPCSTAGACSPLDFESKALTTCSTTTFDVGWQPPKLTADVCGSPSGASISFIGEGFCGLGAVHVTEDPPDAAASIEPVPRAAYLVRTKEGSRIVVWIAALQPSDGLAIEWRPAAQSF